MANWLKAVLGQIISVSQGTFIPGHLISDNILLAHELMHYIRTRPARGAGYCCIKLDMSKAFDRVHWNFSEELLPGDYVNKIMRCVRLVAYRVKVNDLVSDAFFPDMH
ncbi:hypothetical protein QQ045_008885 [Rhodiola kirilowii]